MNTTRNLAALTIGAVLSGLAGVAAADAASDSFTRMLQHEPYGGPTKTALPGNETDVVAAMIRDGLEHQACRSTGDQDLMRTCAAELRPANAPATL